MPKNRDENFPINLKTSYQRIVQKAVNNIEERISETGKGKDTKNLENELEKLYQEEKELLAKLEEKGKRVQL